MSYEEAMKPTISKMFYFHPLLTSRRNGGAVMRKVSSSSRDEFYHISRREKEVEKGSRNVYLLARIIINFHLPV